MNEEEKNEKDAKSGGFFTVSNYLFSYHLKPRDIAVYCCICRHINMHTRVAFPSRKTIARECGIAKEETVDKAIQSLSKNGFIEKRHQYSACGGYVSNVYSLIPISPNWEPGSTVNGTLKKRNLRE